MSDLNKIVDDVLLNAAAKYTVGYSNIDHVLDLVTDDVYEAIASEIDRRIINLYHDPADSVCENHVIGAIYDRALHRCFICRGSLDSSAE